MASYSTMNTLPTTAVEAETPLMQRDIKINAKTLVGGAAAAAFALGALAATAIIRLDEATQTAEFEPVGTHPDFRRRGLGAALQLHGMHLAKAAGAKHMLVACRGAPAHAAARDMYYSVGFRAFTRDLPQIKVAG